MGNILIFLGKTMIFLSYISILLIKTMIFLGKKVM